MCSKAIQLQAGFDIKTSICSECPGKIIGQNPLCSETTSNIHSHKKQKDSLETRALLLIFSLEISGVAVQRIHQNSEKW